MYESSDVLVIFFLIRLQRSYIAKRDIIKYEKK